jgi:hypothetical protein
MVEFLDGVIATLAGCAEALRTALGKAAGAGALERLTFRE